jgi:hypothetical protein
VHGPDPTLALNLPASHSMQTSLVVSDGYTVADAACMVKPALHVQPASS